MLSYLASRLVQLGFVLFAITVLSFALLHLAPGDPAQILLRNQGALLTQTSIQQMRAELGLDQPLPVQYLRWLQAALRLDFGVSFRTGQPVSELLLGRLGATVELAAVALGLALLIAVPLGIFAAVYQNTLVDHLGRLAALVGASMPSFWLGLLLIYLFAVRLGWLPVLGRGSLAHLVLPGLTLALSLAPVYMRLIRASLCDVLREDYIQTARAKGASERRVILRHGLRTALIPVVTLFGMTLAHLLGGTVVVETIFAWPGIGQLAVEAILNRDFPVVQAFVLLLSLAFALANLAVDLSYALLDPRIRVEG